MPDSVNRKHFSISVAHDHEQGRLRHVGHLLQPISIYYPNFNVWLRTTFAEGLVAGERKILIAGEAGRLAGLALLKDNGTEKKICAFFVMPEHRGAGLGTALMREALKQLGEQEIVISVAEERVSELIPLLLKNNFHLSEIKEGYYRKNKKEFYYLR